MLKPGFTVFAITSLLTQVSVTYAATSAPLNLAPAPHVPASAVAPADPTGEMLRSKTAPAAAKKQGIGISASATCTENGSIVPPGSAGYDACVTRAAERSRMFMPTIPTSGPMLQPAVTLKTQ
jgi:hypothetical protein